MEFVGNDVTPIAGKLRDIPFLGFIIEGQAYVKEIHAAQLVPVSSIFCAAMNSPCVQFRAFRASDYTVSMVLTDLMQTRRGQSYG